MSTARDGEAFRHTNQDELTERLALYGSLQILRSRLLVTRSATTTLEEWCLENNLAPEATITAVQQTDIAKAPSPETLHHLQADEGHVTYRHVSLYCGDLAVATADNWYVPQRLSDHMNLQLRSTTPFGKAIAPLKPFRIVLHAQDLWHALPTDWHRMSLVELRKQTQNQPRPDYHPTTQLFSQETLLIQENGAPLSVVREHFAMSLLSYQIARFR